MMSVRVCVCVRPCPRGMVSSSALGEGGPTAVSHTAVNTHWQPRRTSGFVIMKCSRLCKHTVKRWRDRGGGGGGLKYFKTIVTENVHAQLN